MHEEGLVMPALSPELSLCPAALKAARGFSLLLPCPLLAHALKKLILLVSTSIATVYFRVGFTFASILCLSLLGRKKKHRT